MTRAVPEKHIINFSWPNKIYLPIDVEDFHLQQ